jgi:hypothetical protein
LNVNIQKQEITEPLRKLHGDKSPGPDGIHPWVLEECAEEVSMPLIILFRTSLDTGVLPNTWKEANVTPIHKKGDRTSASSYRPVNLQARGKSYTKRTTEAYDRQ